MGVSTTMLVCVAKIFMIHPGRTSKTMSVKVSLYEKLVLWRILMGGGKGKNRNEIISRRI